MSERCTTETRHVTHVDPLPRGRLVSNTLLASICSPWVRFRVAIEFLQSLSLRIARLDAPSRNQR
jgi:hypothetical protein